MGVIPTLQMRNLKIRWSKPFNITVIQVYSTITDAKEAKVDRIYEEVLYNQQKQDQELTLAQIMNSLFKFRLKWKKVGKTTRPFRYDLNQIPYIGSDKQLQGIRSDRQSA